MSLKYRHFEDRSPLLASAVGGVCGLMTGLAVLAGLLTLAFLVTPPGREYGKGGPIVEGLWTLIGIPLCSLAGAIWPHTLGRLFRNAGPLAPRAPTELCPCCGHRTLVERAAFEICPVCFWEDDGQGDTDADEVRGGPNHDLSLTVARRNYREFGACEQRVLQSARAPLPEELP